MKTDLNTTSYPKTQNLKSKLDPLLKDGKKLGEKVLLDKPASSPDYKLDLSTPKLSLPGAPSAPTTPEPPKLDIKKEVAEAKIKEEIKARPVEVIEEKEGTLKKPAIIFIKGWDVLSSPSKSESGYAGMGKLAESVKGSRVYGWDQKDDIMKEIKKRSPEQPIILVGHSFGGDTAVEIANDLDSLDHAFKPVDLLVTIDAIGFNNDIIPQNVREHLNVFGETSFLLNDGPHVARRHEMTNVKNILSPLDHTDIDDSKDIQYEIVNRIQQKLKV